MSCHSSGSSMGTGPHLVPLGMALTPRSLLKRCKLPSAAHLHAPTAPPGLDLSRPLLLYNTYNSTKVRGVSLRPGKDGALIPQGPSIVIPDSYTGWFAIVTSDGHTASYYSTVEQVASSKVTFFLTRYDVPAYTNNEEDDGTVSYQKTVVQSGHVLKLLGIFEDLNARRTNSNGRGHDAASSVFSCDKYAQCLNYRNEVVFLPFSASGRFYTTAQKSSKNPNHVYLMAHILKNHRLPVTVRLVCGYMPRVPCNFTGVLRLEQAQKEAVILACTMTNEAQATLFEIDVNSNFALTPVKDPMFPKTPIFLKTVSYCDDEAEAWRRQIKVTHHVTEKRSRSLTRSLSDKFVEPLSNIRPLSLSFLSDHDKRKGRERDHSREGRPPPTNKDKSRELRFKDFRRRENSVEKTKFTYHDNFSGINSFPLKDSCREHKKGDLRKISKQNTYVLQNGKAAKQTEKKAESESSSFISVRSIENMDYSRVVDDISPISERVEEGESHYTEICPQTLRKKNNVKSDGPLSLPNLNLFHHKKSREEVSRKLSSSSINSNSASLRSHSSLRNQVRQVISNGLSESDSQKGGASAHGHKFSEDNSSRKDRTNKMKFLEAFREKMYDKSTVREQTRERVLEKDKDDEVCCEEIVKRDKLTFAKYRHEDKKHSVNSTTDQTHVDKSNQRLQDGSESSGTNNSRDHVNEVYIIRVVVKDREENHMSTLAKDNSGGYYMKIKGFEVPKEEMKHVIGKDGYDSLC
ncbi:uncharacterized protein LOC126999750 [Eriocheir sinensis]|uniref:uncharacterized protein LOC126999750 n=1 Tax=Eriocheir sinensis TaxID=95602 RepID=UPI0021C70F52|nr:uncharacterized protein LOC126999750 [Eriocheir sinensis]XP_050718558.1 uncharacterized protein LOC126999750 [Eriocheir sinensis]XP_050718559.1 uncharacterized protein LOC126999750 [Eriocheir sinensis]XP_050718560.1 uncharacterized protein LOC126999750 [Eriocheir sinensis]